MITVIFSEPDTAEWRAWKIKAEEAHERLMAAYRNGEPLVISDLYKEQKEEYIRIFSGKCAFCEQLISGNQPGDMEHFRPKKGVSDINHKVITRQNGAVDTPHPGYFWLAYEWTNLLYACESCNRLSKDKGEPGKRNGKGTRFPVKNVHAEPEGPHDRTTEADPFSSVSLVAEGAMLLHPYDRTDDPDVHLDFDELTGCLVPKVTESGHKRDRGQATIDILHLNREPLPEMRKDIYFTVLARFRQYISTVLVKGEDTERDLKFLNDYRAGKKEFSLVGRKAINIGVIQQQAALREFATSAEAKAA